MTKLNLPPRFSDEDIDFLIDRNFEFRQYPTEYAGEEVIRFSAVARGSFPSPTVRRLFLEVLDDRKLSRENSAGYVVNWYGGLDAYECWFPPEDK